MLERGARLGKYEIKDQVGIGAMAWVYKAKHVDNGTPVAVKIPDRRWLSSMGALRQFRKEGQALKGLNHPNIVKVHCLGEQSGLPFIVMDYIDGHALAEVISHKQRFTVGEIVRVLAPIAAALDYSHTQEIIHRDVKPGNIRIRHDGVPVLVDFGIVQTAEGTVWGEGIGSVWYASPEQVSGKRVDGRTDQYSLAVVAYEMLAGKVPFDGNNVVAVAVAQRDTPPPIPAEWPSAISTVIRRVLEKDPGKRYRSCAEFIAVLAEADSKKATPERAASQPAGGSGVEARQAQPRFREPFPPAESLSKTIGRPGQVTKFAPAVPAALVLILLVYLALARTPRGGRPPEPATHGSSQPPVETWNPKSIRALRLQLLGATSQHRDGESADPTPQFSVSTRNILWQCNLVYPPPPIAESVQLEQVLMPGEAEQAQIIPVQLSAGSSGFQVSGSLAPPGGRWRPGVYRVHLRRQDEVLAAASFQVHVDMKPMQTLRLPEIDR